MVRRVAVLTVIVVAVGAALATAAVGRTSDSDTRIGTARVAYAPGTLEVAAYPLGVDLLGSYVVIDDRLVADAGETSGAAGEHRALWRRVRASLPDRQRARIRQFSVVEQGRGATVALIHQSGVDPASWILSVDVADADDPVVLADTLVHEAAHMVTMAPGQFTFSHRHTGTCTGTLLAVGCAPEGSMIDRWADRFWPSADESGATHYDPERHVAPYAATGAHEDLAETFLHWVRGVPADTPTVRAKYRFLSAEPDLVMLAETLA